jgi:hypothetical protein
MFASMRAIASSLIPFALFACAKSSPAPAPDPSASATSSVASASASAPPSAIASAPSNAPSTVPPAPFDPARVVNVSVPASPACTFVRTSTSAPVGGELALRAAFADPPFAYLGSGPFELHVPAGASNGVVSVARAGFEVRGLFGDSGKSGPGLASAFPASPPVLRAAKPIVLGGVLSPTAATPLSFAGATPGKLVTTVRRGLVVSGKVFEAHDCADFTVDEVTFTLPAAPTGPLADKRWLVKGTTPVAANAEGASIVDVESPSAMLPVTVIETTTAGRARVVLDDPRARVVGWVDATRLATKDDGSVALGDFGGLGHGAGRGLADPQVAEYTCPGDVPLYVDATDGRAEAAASVPYALVGTIRKGT